jgi:hypothetical protein
MGASTWSTRPFGLTADVRSVASGWIRPEPAAPVPRRTYVWTVALIALGAASLQLGLFLTGFYRVTADESARSLMAWELSWDNALQPWIWPPFYKGVVGLSLKLFDDVFLIPRLMVALAGIGTLLVSVALSDVLFRNRTVSIATAALAALAPERLVFSVVPLSDIFYFLALLGAGLCLLRWLRTEHASRLLSACALLFAAAAVRYEAVLFGLVLGAFLTWRLLVARDLGVGTYVAAGILLASFPAFWLLQSYLWYGSVENLAITSQQFVAVFGKDYALASREMPALHLLRAALWNPLLLAGLAVAVLCAAADTAMRKWSALLWLPLLLISLATVATLSVTQAASWRTAGFWVLLLLPFEALALVRLGVWLGGAGRRRWAAALLAAVALLPLAVRDAKIVRSGMVNWESRNWREERPVGLFLRDELARLGRGRVLIDSLAGLDFLDVVAGSAVPERFVLTADAPLQEVALALPMRDYYRRQGNTEAIARLLTDRFALDEGGDAHALRDRGIRLILVQDPRLAAALDASPLVEREKRFADWTLYRVRPEARGAGAAATP